jgi:hypothetical protein
MDLRAGTGWICSIVALLASCDANLDAGYNRDSAVRTGPDAAVDVMVPLADNFTVEGKAVQLQLNGDAKLQGNQIVLTEELDSQQGTAVVPTPFSLVPARDFSIELVFQIEYSMIAADGIALVWHADPKGTLALGGAGGGLAIGELKPSVAVVFDTHNGNGNEPAPGISIGHGGDFSSTPLVVRDPPFDLTNGNLVYAWITYRQGVLSVFVSDGNMRPIDPWISTRVDLAAELGAEAFLGVGAATGAKFSRHTLHALRVTTEF